MKLITAQTDYEAYLEQAALAKPSMVCLSTFGLWAGTNHEGRKTYYQPHTSKLLELLRDVPHVYLLIGIGEYFSCKGNFSCQHCEAKYIKGLLRLVATVESFPQFKTRCLMSCHAKSALFFYQEQPKRGLVGGRNLTGSTWADFSFELEVADVNTVWEAFNGLWHMADELTNAKLGEIMERQRINPATLESVANGSA